MRSLSWLKALRNSIYLKMHCPLDNREGKSRVGVCPVVSKHCALQPLLS